MDTIIPSEKDILDALVINKEKFDKLFLDKPNPIGTEEFDTLKDEFFSLKRQLDQHKALSYNLKQENLTMNKSKQIKEILINLAINDKLPNDLNDLDESIFNHLFQDIQPNKTDLLAEAILKHYSERRSDITDMVEDYLKTGTIPTNFKPESRIISASIPEHDLYVEYDTLTTLLSYKKRTETFLKECEDHDYKDI